MTLVRVARVEIIKINLNRLYWEEEPLKLGYSNFHHHPRTKKLIPSMKVEQPKGKIEIL